MHSAAAHAGAGSESKVDLEPVRPVLRRLIERLGPEEIWLIGSRAEHRARAGSDYDLLVVLPDGASDDALDPIAAWQLVRGLGVPVDVIPCTRGEFEEEKHEIDSLPRAAYQRGICIFMSTERRAHAFLDLADQDLLAAEVLAHAGNRYAAYHCQQALEKITKALLLHAGAEAGVEHRLDVLVARLPPTHPLAGDLRAFDRYTPFATTFRYPTPGGRIPAAPPSADVIADIATLRSLHARARTLVAA